MLNNNTYINNVFLKCFFEQCNSLWKYKSYTVTLYTRHCHFRDSWENMSSVSLGVSDTVFRSSFNTLWTLLQYLLPTPLPQKKKKDGRLTKTRREASVLKGWETLCAAGYPRLYGECSARDTVLTKKKSTIAVYPLEQHWWDTGGSTIVSIWGWGRIKGAGVRSGVTDRSSGTRGAICEVICRDAVCACACLDGSLNRYEALTYWSIKHHYAQTYRHPSPVPETFYH